MDGNFAKFEQVSASLNPQARVYGRKTKSPRCKTGTRGTRQLRNKKLAKGNPSHFSHSFIRLVNSTAYHSRFHS
jgi:hypothetical protein